MAGKASIEVATDEHAQYIAAHVRDADRDELWASALRTPLNVMRVGMRFSEGTARTGLVDGVPVCMWGVVPICLLQSIGSPWMVGTNELDKHAVAFLRRNKSEVVEMMRNYDILVNYVDSRNRLAIAWLKWLGFKVEKEAKPHGMLQLPFHRFEMKGE